MSDLWAEVRERSTGYGRKLRNLRYGHFPEPLVLSEMAAMLSTDAPTLSRIEWGRVVPDEELGARLTAWMVQQDRLQSPESYANDPAGLSPHIVTPTPPRATHPDTSRKAMTAVNRDNAWAIHEWVILALGMSLNGLTHEQMWNRYQADITSDKPRTSQSGLRTRVSELVRGGIVADSGRTRTMSTGRQAIVWTLTESSSDG
jgi:hypothetical protein